MNDSQPVRPRHDFLTDAVHVFFLSGLALAQPLFDVLSRGAEFFVARQSRPAEIVEQRLLVDGGDHRKEPDPGCQIRIRVRHLVGALKQDVADAVDDFASCLGPLVSFGDAKWRYTHFGPEVLLWTGNRYIYVEDHQALSTGVLSFWSNLGGHRIKEHEMASYLSSLKRKLDGAEEIKFEERARFLN